MRADFYTYNNPNSVERQVIEGFLGAAEKYVPHAGGMTPAEAVQVRNVINWLRATLDRKPSEMRPPNADG
jgi:hypothetical protein